MNQPERASYFYVRALIVSLRSSSISSNRLIEERAIALHEAWRINRKVEQEVGCTAVALRCRRVLGSNDIIAEFWLAEPAT